MPTKKAEVKEELLPEQREELLRALKARFEKNMHRHKGLGWDKIQAKLEASSEKLWSLNEMERTGGEPDVVGHDKKTGEYTFYDCSAERHRDDLPTPWRGSSVGLASGWRRAGVGLASRWR